MEILKISEITNYLIHVRPNVDGSVPVVSTSAGDQELLQLEVWVDIVESHTKIRISCSWGPVVCCKAHSFAIWKLFGQDFVHLGFAIGIQ